MEGFIVLMAVVFIVWFVFVIRKALKTPLEELEREAADYEAGRVLRVYGPISPQYICSHCQQRGFVRTITVKRKKGVSGAKATGALLTMGISMLATGLSRKEGLTQAHCGNCNSTWDF